MALEKQRMYRKNIDGTKDLLYRETSSDVVKHGSTTVEAKLNELSNLKDNGGSIGGVIVGVQDSLIDKIETSKAYLNIRTLGGRGTQLVITDDSVRPSTEQPNKINLGIPTTPFKDLYIGEYSNVSNGYTRLPNGLIFQWGRSSASVPTTGSKAVSGNVTYPIAFTGGCLQVICSVFNTNATSGSSYQASKYNVVVQPSTLRDFYYYGSTNLPSEITATQLQFSWFAIGF